MIKPPIKYTDKRYIPKAIRDYVDWRDGGVCQTPLCAVMEGLAYDHCPPWNLLIPKRHDPDLIVLRCEIHHSDKSRKDTTNAAKAKRVGKKHRGERQRPKVKFQSPGFPKGGPKPKIPSRGWGR